MVTRWESSDITDLHGALVAFSWSSRLIWSSPWLTSVSLVVCPCDYPGHSQLEDSQHHSFLFNQGTCSGTHSSPPAFVTTASLFPSLCKHHLETIQYPKVRWLLADPQETHVSYTLWTIEWQKYWCSSVSCLGPLDNCPTGHIDTEEIRKLDSKTHLSEKWDTILSSFWVTILVSNYLALQTCHSRYLNYKILQIDWVSTETGAVWLD